MWKCFNIPIIALMSSSVALLHRFLTFFSKMCSRLAPLEISSTYGHAKGHDLKSYILNRVFAKVIWVYRMFTFSFMAPFKCKNMGATRQYYFSHMSSGPHQIERMTQLISLRDCNSGYKSLDLKYFPSFPSMIIKKNRD